MPASPKRGGAVIEPRSYTTNFRKFGNTSGRLTQGPVVTPQQGAAEVQHALCNRIREYLLDEAVTLKAFCEKTELPEGLSYERLYRISNGTTMMGLTDIMFWTTIIPDFADTLTWAVNRLHVPTLAHEADDIAK